MDVTRRIPQVISNGTKQPPTLTAGPLTADLILAWSLQCRHYFRAKEIEPVDQVAKAAIGLQDPGIVTWWFTNEERLTALSFADFIKELRKRSLPKQWADEVLARLVHSSQRDDEALEN